MLRGCKDCYMWKRSGQDVESAGQIATERHDFVFSFFF